MNVLVLNSAQGKYPLGSDRWVQATVRAVESLSHYDGVRLVCSADPHPWSLTTYLAGAHRIPILLVMTESEQEAGSHAVRNFIASHGLDESLVEVRWLPGEHAQVKQHWRERDRLAFDIADVIYPVSIRPRGRHHASLAATAKTVRDDFRISWRREGYLPRYDFAGRRVNPFPAGEWLVHWTRAWPGPWPGEAAAGYYRDMLAHPERYVRSAGNTLARMVRESRIRGSTWRMPGRKAAVSFSANGPGDAMRLMRWRKRYVRYSFEPWGIAIERRALEGMGARQVRYRRCAAGEDRLFTQSPGAAGDWTPESEWRLPGDCDLHRIPAGGMFAIVPEVADAHRWEAVFPDVPCRPLFRD